MRKIAAKITAMTMKVVKLGIEESKNGLRKMWMIGNMTVDGVKMGLIGSLLIGQEKLSLLGNSLLY